MYCIYLVAGKGGGPFQNNPKNIDPPYKKTTQTLGCFARGNPSYS